MPWIIGNPPKHQRCFIRYGKPIGGGRFKCWWCKAVFPSEAAWRRHAR